MRHTILALAALIVLAAPAAAQDPPPTWSSDRPDGVAPAGIVGDRLLETGKFEVAYRFRKMDFEGVQLGTDLLDPLSVLDFYDTTPFSRTDRSHDVSVAYGVTDQLTLLGTAAWIDRTRDLADEQFFFSTKASGISDLRVEALYGVWSRDAIRVHLNAGLEVPVGSTDERADLLTLADQVLPYDMQPGSGSWAVMPGITGQVQNEFGTVGAQIRARLRINDNDRGYRRGDEVEGSMWMAYRVNRFFALNSGLRFRSWGTIEGLDLDLDPSRDPGEDPVFSGGERVDVPIGINVFMPEGVLEGHRLSVELLFPVHQDFDAVRLAGDWGLSIGWRTGS